MAKQDMATYYNKKRVLVPGGAGFIGSNLSRRLIGMGAEVTIVDPFNQYCGANTYNIADIAEKARLEKDKIEEFMLTNDLNGFDLIINCIGLTNHHIGYKNVALDYDINCLSALRILEKLAASGLSTRLISIGTRNQFGRSASKMIDESSSMNPLDVQAVHKVTLEQYHKVISARCGLDTVFVRLTNTYGPAQRLGGDGIGVVGEALRSALEGKELIIYGSADRVKDLVFVDDVVDALLLTGLLPAHKGCEVYNVGGCSITMGSLADAITDKIPITTKVIPFPDNIKKMDTGDTIFDTSKIFQATGWKACTDIAEGIGRTLDFYMANRRAYLPEKATVK